MIEINNTLISREIINIHFCCDLTKCRGICCVEGDAGAPLEESEADYLENNIEKIYPFMHSKSVGVVKKYGVMDYDISGEMVTPLIENKDCAFVIYDNDIAKCAIEEAYKKGQINFIKPISCHLYPIRLSKLSNGKIAVNYHFWHICQTAIKNGVKKDISLYVFLKEPLIRRFGKEWYEKLGTLLL
ncbi:MAG: DUF3109 domain-containing protein [Bacteroidetes bacterium HGW-Bacteroidetes-15]|nr:MAG: DUF3109 domain-containing protein [Bacteroidetes bacterium HGW-Bacteroidetes-15]